MERSEKQQEKKGRIENDEYMMQDKGCGGGGGGEGKKKKKGKNPKLRVLGITIKLRETSLITKFLFKLHYFKVSNHFWSLFLIGFKDYIKAQLHPIQFSTTLSQIKNSKMKFGTKYEIMLNVLLHLNMLNTFNCNI